MDDITPNMQAYLDLVNDINVVPDEYIVALVNHDVK